MSPHHRAHDDGRSAFAADIALCYLSFEKNKTAGEKQRMEKSGISRRAVLAGTAAAGAMGFARFPARAAEPQWKKFAGTKLEVILAKGPRGDNLQRYAKEFTELTGIQVESEQIPEQQQRQKVVIELASGKPSFDVIHLSYHVQKRQFEKAGWLADLSGYMKDTNLTAPDLVESDFSAAGLQYARKSDFVPVASQPIVNVGAGVSKAAR